MVNRAGFAKVSLVAEAAGSEVSGIRLPLALSLAAHAACLAAAVRCCPHRLPVRAEAIAKGGIEVAFDTSLPKRETPPRA